jgi:4-aminobutyrate aminotransferase-like enzyme
MEVSVGPGQSMRMRSMTLQLTRDSLLLNSVFVPQLHPFVAMSSSSSASASTAGGLSTSEGFSIRASHLGSNYVTSYTAAKTGPLHIASGRAEFIYTVDGKKYLDAYNNVTHLGHSHPSIRDAATKQLDTINTNTRYLYDSLPLYVKALLSTFPGDLNYDRGSAVFLCNSGSEANDLALRMAAILAGSRETIVIDYAYHGVSQAALEASPYLAVHGVAGEWYQGKADFIHISELPDGYRGRFRHSDVQCGDKYAQSVRDHIAAIQAKGKRVSAFLGESILGCGGQIVLPRGYIATVYDAVHKAGGVCIADEVQVSLTASAEDFRRLR